jgi:hypothetical protein
MSGYIFFNSLIVQCLMTDFRHLNLSPKSYKTDFYLTYPPHKTGLPFHICHLAELTKTLNYLKPKILLNSFLIIFNFIVYH